ncbi:uncharacterized protein LOC124152831 [Haliotis rufescens]|uniref:uncharacterized protein LOC124152831 n=1 Tax=Haliotis rufescens TaxID=6454 RepID=UPI00201F4B9A|nr:uncharacterized protein LOC124152831 [Haliotis rufescens]
MGCSGSTAATVATRTTHINNYNGYNDHAASSHMTKDQQQNGMRQHSHNLQQTVYQDTQTTNPQQIVPPDTQTHSVHNQNVLHSGQHQIQPVPYGAAREQTTVRDDEEKELEKFRRLQPYSRRLISHHNRDIGWMEWAVFGKRVYDCSRVRNNTTFLNMIIQRKMEHYPSLYLDFWDKDMWRKNAPLLMQSVGFGKVEIHHALAPYVLGRVEEVQLSEYWCDVRKDIVGLDQGLSEAEDISPYEQELLEQAKRWLASYRDIDPKEQWQRLDDPNGLPFPLPEDVARKPDVLRMWIIEWEQFDTADAELLLGELTELSDKTNDLEAHGVFAQTLRPFDVTEDLKFDDPEWEMLPVGVIANDVTIPHQDEINRQRDKRTDLQDTKRMSGRQKQLAQYFIDKYEWQPEKLTSYLQWADVMKDGDLRFAALCEQS